MTTLTTPDKCVGNADGNLSHLAGKGPRWNTHRSRDSPALWHWTELRVIHPSQTERRLPDPLKKIQVLRQGVRAIQLAIGRYGNVF